MMQLVEVIDFATTAYRLGLLSDELVDLAGSPLNALCSHLQKKLQYKPGERDAIYLHHFIGIEWPDKKVSGVKYSLFKMSTLVEVVRCVIFRVCVSILVLCDDLYHMYICIEHTSYCFSLCALGKSILESVQHRQ